MPMHEMMSIIFGKTNKQTNKKSDNFQTDFILCANSDKADNTIMLKSTSEHLHKALMYS